MKRTPDARLSESNSFIFGTVLVLTKSIRSAALSAPRLALNLASLGPVDSSRPERGVGCDLCRSRCPDVEFSKKLDAVWPTF